MTFDDLNLIDPILKALKEEGYTNPTPIQEQAIPHVLEGKDLLGVAQTGTGKTAAFTVPILQVLHRTAQVSNHSSRAIRCLVLTPTRELAIQINESFGAYGRHLSQIRHTVIFGGVGQHPQVQALKRGVEVLIATPGRLLDLMNQGFVDLRQIEVFVLDEADRMLDMGFIHDIKRILPKLPAKRQTLFFSATMPGQIQELAASILRPNPVRVAVTPVSSTADTVTQSVYLVENNDKPALLRHILQDKDIKRVLVFTRTKHGADKVVKALAANSIPAEAIHGNKSQNHRQRALANFKSGSTRVLVATDIAARGIDVDELTHVINYEIPNEPETYVHRIGRTGRAGAFGTAFSFVEDEERAYLQDIQKLIRRQIDVDEHPFDSGRIKPVMLHGNERIIRPKGPAGRPPRGPREGGNGGGGRSGGGQGGGRSGGGRGERPSGSAGNSGGGRSNGERSRPAAAPGSGQSDTARRFGSGGARVNVGGNREGGDRDFGGRRRGEAGGTRRGSF
ncbi:DEAD/DEAH box helicase [Hymenobacter properus]|uniref:DEAD-box ATP-dependent RNA helicase RhpA n=1 Tax=Hymenobacter properus TaxID=2791026 RepID=A0A931BHN5_9BACT|nr:DEAD/DEAH box helicase [Hymenobacter properus]MBF9140388.1 DEAD/DEAH box helicase [Hymenobacter properus]MBR7719195.1 DEAD/DEAH box helicase [Microvirga sp. SRT04]